MQKDPNRNRKLGRPLVCDDRQIALIRFLRTDCRWKQEAIAIETNKCRHTVERVIHRVKPYDREVNVEEILKEIRGKNYEVWK